MIRGGWNSKTIQLVLKPFIKWISDHQTTVKKRILGELLLYNELNLTEIAYKLHYSSVAHLSNQFKKMTELTPSHFKNLKNKNPSALGNA